MFKSLNSKVYFSIGTAMVILFGLFAFIFINHQKRTQLENSFDEASMISEIITKAVNYNMPRGNRPCVIRIMGIIGGQEQISHVRMVNDRGIVTFSSRTNEIGEPVSKTSESCIICHRNDNTEMNLKTPPSFRIYESDGEEVLGLMTPVYNQPDCYTSSKCHVHNASKRKLGILDVRMSISVIKSEIQNSILIFILFLITVILFFILIMAFIISKFVTSPVKQLVSGTEKVAHGDLDVDIKVSSRDEIGQLADSFNRMIIDLKVANEEIRTWSTRMEKKIEERTKKLYLTRAKLIQSEKMASMGVLASSVAHEINNPLQGILTYIKLMLKVIRSGPPTEENVTEFEEYLGMMGTEIERCGDMVKNLLVFSKQSKLEIRDEDINQIIDNALKLIDNKIRLQNIQIKTELNRNIPLLKCDKQQIQQSLIALLINACEAMGENGEIVIKTSQFDHQYILIVLADTGSGIREENLHNIFDPFYSTKESSKNTGLGLFVVYGIIKEHGGTIEVKSKLGEGTEFLIKMPISSKTEGESKNGGE